MIPEIMIIGPPLRGPSAGESFRSTGVIEFEVCCESSSTDTGWELASSSGDLTSREGADDGSGLGRCVRWRADLYARVLLVPVPVPLPLPFALTTNSYGRRD